MAAPKGLLAILSSGKGKPAPDAEESSPSSSPGGGDSVGKRAAQDAIDAINGDDAAGLYDALERVVRACQGESEMEE
jgi:hypothetical protein